MNYACAATIGAVSGLRSMTGPAIIATAARARELKVDGTALAWFGSPKAAPVVTALAVGEMIADKLPFMPDRTRPGSLAGRAITGALCGYAVFSPRGRRKAVMGAVVGASAALAASWAGFEYRRRAPMPSFVAALIEDVVAAAAGAFAIRKICA
jgi:uncharacterized membrane protein